MIFLIAVGFLPNNSHSVHHMLLYGCDAPGSEEDVWNCGGEMAMNGEETTVKMPVCQGDEKIIYAWAHNAPNLELPEGVGFEVGGDSPIQYLVLQIHYNDHITDKRDYSGLTLLHTPDE